MDTNLKDIKNFEGLYAINKNGQVWSYPKMNGPAKRVGHWLKPYLHNGYLYNTLCKNSKYKTRLTHRLVAETFISNDFNKKEVNHTNGNKLDNRINNLEWVTPSENSQHAYAMGLSRHIGLKGEKNPKAKLTDKQVLKIRSLRGIITEDKLSKKYGVVKSVISAIMLRKSWKHI